MATVAEDGQAGGPGQGRRQAHGQGTGESAFGHRQGRHLSRAGWLRLGVQGGGCSGLSYNIRFDTQPRERDRIFQFGDVRVF